MAFSVTFTITLLLTYAIHLTAAVGLKEFSTALGADSWFADVVVTKASYYRALCDANPVTYDDGVAFAAQVDATNCSLEYDYWSGYGQIIFRMGREDNQDVDIINSTYFAIDHWYDLRSSYRPTEDDYDELQPFWGSWEFTQMVWKSNTKVGCAWQNIGECPVTDEANAEGLPISRFKQLLCYFTPGGNKWDHFGLQYTRQYGKAMPAPGASKPLDKAYWDAELERIEAARYMHASDFLPPRPTPIPKPVSSADISSGTRPSHITEVRTTHPIYTTLPDHLHVRPTSTGSATMMGPGNGLPFNGTYRRDFDPYLVPPSSVPAPTANSRLMFRDNGPETGDWQDVILGKINKWRGDRGLNSLSASDNRTANAIAFTNACMWPMSQAVNDYPASSAASYGFWVADASDKDWSKEFDYALHTWEVWGQNTTTCTGNLWHQWFTQLTSNDAKDWGCDWSPNCKSIESDGAYVLVCTSGPRIPFSDDGAPDSPCS